MLGPGVSGSKAASQAEKRNSQREKSNQSANVRMMLDDKDHSLLCPDTQGLTQSFLVHIEKATVPILII